MRMLAQFPDLAKTKPAEPPPPPCCVIVSTRNQEKVQSISLEICFVVALEDNLNSLFY